MRGVTNKNLIVVTLLNLWFRIELENKKAAEEEPKKKKLRRNAAVYAEDMSLVTPENAAQRPGWKVSALGRVTRPVKMRPAHPLAEPQEEKKAKKHSSGRDKKLDEEKKNKKRVKDPDTRARRQVIDMPKYGSTHLKGMFLDLEVTGSSRRSPPAGVKDVVSSSDSDSEDEVVSLPPVKPPPRPSAVAVAGPSKIQPENSPPKHKEASTESLSVLDESMDVQKEKAQTLSLLNKLFGNDEDDDWVGRESVGSDIDVDELVKGDVMLVDEDQDTGFEVVPKSVPGKPLYIPSHDVEEDDDEEDETDNKMAVDPSPQKKENPSKKTTLKDLFAPREEEGKF